MGKDDFLLGLLKWQLSGAHKPIKPIIHLVLTCAFHGVVPWLPGAAAKRLSNDQRYRRFRWQLGFIQWPLRARWRWTQW
jgi:hypothetical protein